jgi:hypothetical protein
MKGKPSPFSQTDLNRVARAAKMSGLCAEIDFAQGRVRLVPEGSGQPPLRQGDTDPSIIDEINKVLGDG